MKFQSFAVLPPFWWRDATLEEWVWRDIAPGAATCYSIREADGLRKYGSAWTNKPELAERLAGRRGVSKAAAKDAADGVFEAIGEA